MSTDSFVINSSIFDNATFTTSSNTGAFVIEHHCFTIHSPSLIYSAMIIHCLLVIFSITFGFIAIFKYYLKQEQMQSTIKYTSIACTSMWIMCGLSFLVNWQAAYLCDQLLLFNVSFYIAGASMGCGYLLQIICFATRLISSFENSIFAITKKTQTNIKITIIFSILMAIIAVGSFAFRWGIAFFAFGIGLLLYLIISSILVKITIETMIQFIKLIQLNTNLSVSVSVSTSTHTQSRTRTRTRTNTQSQQTSATHHPTLQLSNYNYKQSMTTANTSINDNEITTVRSSRNPSTAANNLCLELENTEIFAHKHMRSVRDDDIRSQPTLTLTTTVSVTEDLDSSVNSVNIDRIDVNHMHMIKQARTESNISIGQSMCGDGEIDSLNVALFELVGRLIVVYSVALISTVITLCVAIYVAILVYYSYDETIGNVTNLFVRIIYTSEQLINSICLLYQNDMANKLYKRYCCLCHSAVVKYSRYGYYDRN